MGLSLHSRVLNLDLRLEQGRLYFYDPVTRQPLRSLREAEQDHQAAETARQEAEIARQEAEEQARREAAARQTAEARIAELEARLRALE